MEVVSSYLMPKYLDNQFMLKQKNNISCYIYFNSYQGHAGSAGMAYKW